MQAHQCTLILDLCTRITRYGSILYIGIAKGFCILPFIFKSFKIYFHVQVNLTFNHITIRFQADLYTVDVLHAGLFLPQLIFLGGSMVASCNNCMHAEESLGTRLEKSAHML